MVAAKLRVRSKLQMSSSVACVKADTGLKVRLPQSLTQSSLRMSVDTGVLNPAAIMACANAVTRSDFSPLGSPKVKRLPSMSLTTPGATNSAAG